MKNDVLINALKMVVQKMGIIYIHVNYCNRQINKNKKPFYNH